MNSNKLQLLKIFLKNAIFSALIILVCSCSGDESENNIHQSINKLYATEGFGSDLKFVEIDPASGNLISTIFDPEPMQASFNANFTYYSATNQLMFRRNLYENTVPYQLVKVNIDTKEVDIIPSEDYSNIIAGNGKLFGLKRIFINTLLSIDLVEINPENASTKSTMQIFEAMEDAPQNDKTGVSDILYSQATNQLLIPRRISFTTNNSADQLIKINASNGAKEVITINHYESIIVGKNGRLFAVKRSYTDNVGLTFYGIVEVDINNGVETNIVKEFDLSHPFTDYEITFLGATNEILIWNGPEYKINVDTGIESTFNNAFVLYRFRSINVY